MRKILLEIAEAKINAALNQVGTTWKDTDFTARSKMADEMLELLEYGDRDNMDEYAEAAKIVKKYI